ncbi:MAG TPA: hypothetical protein VFX58_02425 [Chitinophagaceae bacterium]|nr:hypothetical protein [Chitinophagaceae bacterium]
MKRFVDILGLIRRMLAILVICITVVAGTQFMLLVFMNLLGIPVPDFIAG